MKGKSRKIGSGVCDEVVSGNEDSIPFTGLLCQASQYMTPVHKGSALGQRPASDNAGPTRSMWPVPLIRISMYPFDSYQSVHIRS
jgi:hypothetical protein